MSKFGILIISSDGYTDLHGLFFSQLKKNFIGLESLPIIMVGQSVKTDSDQFCKFVSTGTDSSWTSRLKTGINHLNCEYVLLLLDDYILMDIIDIKYLENLVNVCKERDIKNLRLINKPLPKIIGDDFDYYSHSQPYVVSTQPGIWNAKFLEKISFLDLTPWEFERRASMFIEKSDVLACTKNYYFPFIDAVYRGKFNDYYYDLLLSMYPEIINSNRKKMDKWDNFFKSCKDLIHSLMPESIINVYIK